MGGNGKEKCRIKEEERAGEKKKIWRENRDKNREGDRRIPNKSETIAPEHTYLPKCRQYIIVAGTKNSRNHQ